MTRTTLLALAVTVAFAGTSRAEVYRILDDPREAAQARIDLIRQAKSEIEALYFLARNDRVTLGALALLRDARRRGVPTVRLVVDANFQHIPKAVLAHLREEGVEVRVYHPLTLRHPSWLFRRMHDKLVLVDRARYITGGRNLAESYFGLAKGKNYVDRDVYVDGESALEADRHFERVWTGTHVAALKVHVSPERVRRASALLDEARRNLECNGFVSREPPRNWSEGQNDAGPVRYLHDFVHEKEAPRVAVRLADEIARAKRSIIIESPYLVPSRAVRELLDRKLAEGVYVLILTNSLRSTDGILPQVAYLKYRRRLRRAGIDIREYKGPDTMHAKSAVIDGTTVLIGSYNLDPRSQNLNTEVMCAVDDRETALELLDSIDAHLRNSWVVGQEPRMSRARRFKNWAARLLMPLIEKQL